MGLDKVHRSNLVKKDNKNAETNKFDPQSDDTMYSIFKKVVDGDPNKTSSVDYESLSKAQMLAESYYSDLDKNHNGVFEENEIDNGSIRNYINEKDGKPVSTSFVDLTANIYKKLVNKNNGERVEKQAYDNGAENKSYYDKNNKMYKREYSENGVLVAKFEYPDDKTENYTNYEDDGKTVKYTQVDINDGNKVTKTRYDKNGKITEIFENTTEKVDEKTTKYTHDTKDANGKLKEKNIIIDSEDYNTSNTYDGNGKLLRQKKIFKDSNGDWTKTVTDGDGNPTTE